MHDQHHILYFSTIHHSSCTYLQGRKLPKSLNPPMIQKLMTLGGSPAGSLLGTLNHSYYGPTRTWPLNYQAVSSWIENGTEMLGKLFKVSGSCSHLMRSSFLAAKLALWLMVTQKSMIDNKTVQLLRDIFSLFSIPSSVQVSKPPIWSIIILCQLLFRDKLSLPLWAPSGKTWSLIFHYQADNIVHGTD